MRAIAVDQETACIVVIVGIAADMRAPIYDEDLLSKIPRQSFGNDRAGKTGANNEIVEHFLSSSQK